MRKLIIGGTGTVGFYCVRKLKELNQNILVATRDIPRAKDRLKHFGDIEFVEFDLCDERTYENALQNVDSILIIKPNNIDKMKYLKNFIDKATSNYVKHIVFLSTIDSEKNKINLSSKIEEYIKSKDVVYTIIRSNIFMENLIYPHAKEIRTLGKILIPAGNSKISLVSAEDVGEVCSVVLLNPFIHKNKTYKLTGDTAFTYKEVAEILSEILDKKIIYTNPSFSLYKSQLKKNGYTSSYANLFMFLYTISRVGALKNITNDVEKLLFRKPITIKEFALKYKVNWLSSKEFLLNREV